jgi:hypothetical protein
MRVARALRRSFKWPRIDVYGSGSRGDIKLLSVHDLDRLTVSATTNPTWSANGRPEWLEEQENRIRTLMLAVVGTEGRGVYRCLVTAVLDDESKCKFTLDVSVDDFDGLPDLSLDAVLSLAHKYLLGFPSLELDPAQKESWRRLKKGADG